MVSIGTIIGDRYEILEKVGSGGMADVFRAKCHRLNRYVAIKILKQDYSEDTKFVTKFRGEAQAIAGISHPNIVGSMMSEKKTVCIISLWNLSMESH